MRDATDGEPTAEWDELVNGLMGEYRLYINAVIESKHPTFAGDYSKVAAARAALSEYAERLEATAGRLNESLQTAMVDYQKVLAERDRSWEWEKLRADELQEITDALGNYPAYQHSQTQAEAITQLFSEVASLRTERDALRQFVELVLGEYCWGAYDIDGGSVQDKAEKMGLIVTVPASPEFRDEYDADEMFVPAWSPLASRPAGWSVSTNVPPAPTPSGTVTFSSVCWGSPIPDGFVTGTDTPPTPTPQSEGKAAPSDGEGGQ